MTVTVVKRFTFEAAHRLTNHYGHCRNIHGHNYVVDICVAREDYSVSGKTMVIDFGELKAVVGQWIKDYLDHSLILWEKDFFVTYLKEETKLFLMDLDPTAEALGQMILKQIESLEFSEPIIPCWVKIWETETSYALCSK